MWPDSHLFFVCANIARTCSWSFIWGTAKIYYKHILKIHMLKKKICMFYSVKMDMASIQFEELTILWAKKKMSQIKVYSFSFKNMAIKSLKVWVCVCECVCSAVHSCPALCDPTGCSPSDYVWASPGKNTGVSCHLLLQGICLTQRLNSISCVSCIGRWVLYPWATWEYQICVCSCILMLILIVIWQKPTQHCKASILLFRKRV